MCVGGGGGRGGGGVRLDVAQNIFICQTAIIIFFTIFLNHYNK